MLKGERRGGGGGVSAKRGGEGKFPPLLNVYSSCRRGGLSHHAYEITIAYSLVNTITYLYG